MQLPLAQLLRAYIRAFSARPDVSIIDAAFAPPLTAEERAGLPLPPELDVFAETLGGVEFTWMFEQDKHNPDQSKGENGGRLAIPSIRNFAWHLRPSGVRGNFAARAVLDSMTPEGIGWWIHRANESPKEARTAFENANDCTLKPMDSLKAYLTMGARYAFVWYWQAGTGTGRGYYDRLRGASVPLNTSTAKIEARLVDVGLLPEEAAGLYKWLGASVVLLLHRDGSRTTPNTTSSSEKPPANTTKNSAVTNAAAKATGEKTAKKPAAAKATGEKTAKKPAAAAKATGEKTAKKPAAGKTGKKMA
ncbi:hypothetical protein OV203_47495 [Nannocystis sp. ILAH1]|uniref:hypothetical protein n=1 Tax=unclassified Nannocystis TaxID=2627009 RepID=UPI0022718176|nr:MULTISPECIES: hypothetical protein [unclassified Nannocystis]MCY0994864.1 hypothetical protein [Nannocystis sp. ILAH1]MCY1065306.1 hypothetical protein [Nannocystis sp. RBIL2]